MCLFNSFRIKVREIFFGRLVPITVTKKSCENSVGKCYTRWSLNVEWNKEGWSFQWQRKDDLGYTWYDVEEDVNPYTFRTFEDSPEDFKIRCKIYNCYCNKTRRSVVIKIKQ